MIFACNSRALYVERLLVQVNLQTKMKRYRLQGRAESLEGCCCTPLHATAVLAPVARRAVRGDMRGDRCVEL